MTEASTCRQQASGSDTFLTAIAASMKDRRHVESLTTCSALVDHVWLWLIQ
tara:strand:+ start:744 stop:896 length:153 start_codon:yes stop_codon:yes gene_type:complete